MIWLNWWKRRTQGVVRLVILLMISFYVKEKIESDRTRFFGEKAAKEHLNE